MKKLKLLLLPLLMLLLLIVKTTPTNAALIDVWEDITCPADIDCTIRAASAAGINFLFRSTVGKDSDELTASDVNQMARGEWNKGMVSAVGKIGALAYTIPPTGDHFANIIKNTLSNNILNSKANAQEPQGSGDDILSIIEPFWRGTRNVAYGLFVVVMVAIGFMIILQRQLPTRTVVTFTYALPRILIGLVLITFSLPLIALIVDIFVFFASALVASIAASTAIENIASTVPIEGAADAISTFLTLFAGNVIGIVVTFATGGLVQLIMMTILIIGGIVLFVLTMIRLLSSYVWILVYTIFSPIVILFGSLPGQEGTITDLGKKLIAKALVFPLILFFVILALFFAAYTLNPAATSIISGGNFGQVIGTTVLFSGSILGPILTLFMLAAAYKAPSLLEEGLGLNKPRGKK
ncbi:MAG TPA: hypothetical protein VJ327_06005 [Patescibacteria group bacterium]|nr:hypothetical protein [Patescibacteria group bacterium]